MIDAFRGGFLVARSMQQALAVCGSGITHNFLKKPPIGGYLQGGDSDCYIEGIEAIARGGAVTDRSINQSP